MKLCRAGDRALQLLLFNEEFLVSASHQLALTTSLPFVHTARRYYRLNGSVRPSDWSREVGNGFFRCWKVGQTWSFRGSKSRNKVSVGEPAEGSLMKSSFRTNHHPIVYLPCCFHWTGWPVKRSTLWPCAGECRWITHTKKT